MRLHPFRSVRFSSSPSLLLLGVFAATLAAAAASSISITTEQTVQVGQAIKFQWTGGSTPFTIKVYINNKVVSSTEGWTGTSIQWRASESQVPNGSQVKIRVTDKEGTSVMSDATKVIGGDGDDEDSSSSGGKGGGKPTGYSGGDGDSQSGDYGNSSGGKGDFSSMDDPNGSGGQTVTNDLMDNGSDGMTQSGADVTMGGDAGLSMGGGGISMGGGAMSMPGGQMGVSNDLTGGATGAAGAAGSGADQAAGATMDLGLSTMAGGNSLNGAVATGATAAAGATSAISAAVTNVASSAVSASPSSASDSSSDDSSTSSSSSDESSSGSKTKWVIGGIVLLLLLAAAGGGFWWWHNKQNQGDDPSAAAGGAGGGKKSKKHKSKRGDDDDQDGYSDEEKLVGGSGGRGGRGAPSDSETDDDGYQGGRGGGSYRDDDRGGYDDDDQQQGSSRGRRHHEQHRHQQPPYLDHSAPSPHVNHPEIELFSASPRIRAASTSSATPQSPASEAPTGRDQPTAEVVTEAAPEEDGKEGVKEKIKIGEVRRLAELAKPERKTIGIALGLLCVSSTVSLSIPFGIGRIIDIFSGSSADLPMSVPSAAALLAVFFGIGAAANMGRTILMRISGQRIVARLRERAYGNVLKQDIGWHDLQGASLPSASNKALRSPAATSTAASTASLQSKQTGVRSTGDIISRLGSDAGIVGESLTRELSEGLRALVTATVGIGAMVWISTKVTLVMLAVVPPISIGAVFYGRFLKTLSRKTQAATGEMVSVSEERLGAIRTVQAFNAVEPQETKMFSEKVNKIFAFAKTEAWASGLFFGGAGFAGNMTLIALLAYGGSLVAKGEISVGDLTSLMVYTFYIGSSLIGLTSFFGTIMKGLGASSRIFELLDARPLTVHLGRGLPLPVTTPPRRLVFDNVRFAYPSRPGNEILKGVNLEIQPGTITSIAGGSGSGKSTLANLLIRYYDPSSGRVLYGEEDIKDYSPESWRQRIAIVPQDPALFSCTIAENSTSSSSSFLFRPSLFSAGVQNKLEFESTTEEIEEAARLANCGFIEGLPRGFETQVGARGAQLSGGQRQRLAIARALLQKPKILVADEATSALDAASESLVNQAISNISASQQLTTILIAHRLSTLKTADKVVMMENGQVAEQGTYEELAREGTRFNYLVRSQLLGGVPPAR
ncbi:hypothetical protein JCM11641_004802 [Rhodosporidiobolus odoratus]